MGNKVNIVIPSVELNDQLLKNLSEKGHLIGLHGYNHPFKFSDLSISI